MLKYVKRAFFATIRLPLVGRVPLNVLFVAAVIGLGAVREWRPVWLFGAWLEAAYLLAVAGNKRFQRAVDAEERARQQDDPAAQRRALMDQLAPPARARLVGLESRCALALEAAGRNGAEAFTLDSHRDGLDRLSWYYLKLLLAKQLLTGLGSGGAAPALPAQAEGLRSELADPGLAATVRESKAETLRILERRIELAGRRAQTLIEIDADLARIEAEVELAVENAALGPSAPPTARPVTLASALLENDLFGGAQPAVEAIDRAFEHNRA